MSEIRDVPGVVGYGVDRHGAIYTRRCHSGALLAEWRRMALVRSGTGYLFVNMTHPDGKRRGMYVHRAVALAFLGPIPDGKEVSHKNGRRDDNRLHNLICESHRDNERRKRGHGTHQAGLGNGRAKLTPGDVQLIRQSYAVNRGTKGFRKRLAEQYGVTEMAIYYAAVGKTWREEPGPELLR